MIKIANTEAQCNLCKSYLSKKSKSYNMWAKFKTTTEVYNAKQNNTYK